MKKRKFNIRFFNHIKMNKDTVTKVCNSSDFYYQEKFKNEIEWLVAAQKIIPYCVPKVIDYSTNKNNLFVKYVKIQKDTIHDCLISKEKINWTKLVKVLKKHFNKCQKISPTDKEILKDKWQLKIKKFYIDRTISQIDRLEKEVKVTKNNKNLIFFTNEFIYINNKKYPSLKTIRDFLNKQKKKQTGIFKDLIQLEKNRICFSHLDMVFSNMFLDTKNQLKLIDARGSFDTSKKYGDKYYDYAKIWQCINGLYDFIIEDEFYLQVNKNKVNYKIKSPKLSKYKKEIIKTFPKSKTNIIFLIEALQFLNMPPYHKDKPRRQTVMICTGITHFCDLVKETWK